MPTVRRTSVAVALAVTLLAFGARTAQAADIRQYYLSLGDSAAAGLQPPGLTGLGYADQLAVRLRITHPQLRLLKLGCPGETSASFRTGVSSPCTYAAGSQLNQALRSLRAHRGRVALVTLNVGVNDVLEACLNEQTLALDPGCVRNELPRVTSNVAMILATLKQAAADVPVVAMTYWDPFLGLWINGPKGESAARTSNEAMRTLNAGLASTFRQVGIPFADVAGPDYFNITDFRRIVTVRGVLPRNVAKACQWTWFCRASPIGPDPHPTTRGYGVIADAIDDVLATTRR